MAKPVGQDGMLRADWQSAPHKQNDPLPIATMLIQFVSLNVVVKVPTAAVTVNVPATPFAVSVGAIA
jgi:hypothetical protein